MADQHVGDQIDALGVTLDLDDGDHITDVIVIAKIDTIHRRTHGMVAIGRSEGTDVITMAGLIVAAEEIARGEWIEPPDDA